MSKIREWLDSIKRVNQERQRLLGLRPEKTGRDYEVSATESGGLAIGVKTPLGYTQSITLTQEQALAITEWYLGLNESRETSSD